jgi:hypothetical protein
MQGKVVQVNSVIVPDSLEADETATGEVMSSIAVAG